LRRLPASASFCAHAGSSGRRISLDQREESPDAS
jgi:hypothetical protein